MAFISFPLSTQLKSLLIASNSHLTFVSNHFLKKVEANQMLIKYQSWMNCPSSIFA